MSLVYYSASNISKALQNQDLIAIENVNVTVTNLDGDIVLLYTDKENSPKSNPFTADDSGMFGFYVEAGQYIVNTEKGGNTGSIKIDLTSSELLVEKKPRKLFSKLFDSSEGFTSMSLIEFGDSLAYRKNSCWLPIIDRKLNGLSSEPVNTAGTLAGGGVPSFGGDFSQSGLHLAEEEAGKYEYWLTGDVLRIDSGGYADYQFGGVDPSFYNIKVYFVKEPGAGDITLEVDSVDVDTQSANSSIGLGIISFDQGVSQSSLKLKANNGSVRILFVHGLYGLYGVNYYTKFEKGGLLWADAMGTDTGVSIVGEVIYDINPDLCTFEVDDNLFEVPGSSAFSTFVEMLNNKAKYSDKLVYTSTPRQVNDNIKKETSDYLISLVSTYDQSWLVFNGYDVFGSYDEMTEIFGANDGVHPSPSGSNFLASLVLDFLGMNSEILGFNGRAINDTSQISRMKRGTQIVGPSGNSLSFNTDDSFGLDWNIEAPRTLTINENFFGSTLFQVSNSLSGIPNIIPEKSFLGNPNEDPEGVFKGLHYIKTGGSGFVKRMQLIDTEETADAGGIEGVIIPQTLTKSQLLSGSFPANGLKNSIVRVTDGNQGDALYLAEGVTTDDWRKILTDKGVNQPQGTNYGMLSSFQQWTGQNIFTNQNNIHNSITPLNQASNIGSNSSRFFEIWSNNFLPFTGSHIALIEKGSTVSIGDIICTTGLVSISDISNTLTTVEVSKSKNQKSCRGAFVSKKSINDDFPENIDINDCGSLVLTHDIIIYNGVGDGAINVCGENGDIDIGDLITTSSIKGKGMRQSDDIIRNITVAESQQKASFSSPDEVKQIAVIYKSG